MSRGKYSVLAYKEWSDDYEFKYNCYGQLPEPWSLELKEQGVEYNSLTMFPDYDEEGYDSYGYSAFDKEGNFVDHGSGIDRAGWTEDDYLHRRDLSRTVYLAVCIDRRRDDDYEAFTYLDDAISKVKEHCKNYLEPDEALEEHEENIWEYYCKPTCQNYGYVKMIKVNGVE